MRSNTKLYIKILIIIVAAGTVGGYAFFRTSALLEGPRISIDSPQNGATLDESLVLINGKAFNVSSLELNNRKIFTDKAGNIHEELLLTYGYNEFKIHGEDRFGREASKTLELVYK